jgi:glycerol uptake facilitator-like aquaporin
MIPASTVRRLVAEALGTAFLLAAVVGSGIMAERLAGGNQAIALLANTFATGAALVVLIEIFAPVSGAHFNPAVTLFFALRRDLGAAFFGGSLCRGAIGGCRRWSFCRARDVRGADFRSLG